MSDVPAKDHLARYLSILFDSSVLAAPVFIGVAIVETGALLPALGWATCCCERWVRRTRWR